MSTCKNAQRKPAKYSYCGFWLRSQYIDIGIKILAASNIEILQIHVTGAVFISVWDNRTKKIETRAPLLFEISGGYFERISTIAPGMIADCILRPDFLDEFEIIINFKDQCMYNKDENSSRRQQFVSEEMGNVELKERAPIRE